MSTMTDVAIRAGVSAATVSRYLAGHRVREADRVAQAIAALNFTPSAAARSLKSGQTKTLALVVPDIGNPFFSAVARGVEQVAAEHGFTIELHNAGESGRREAEILRKIIGRVDGVIIAPVAEDDDAPAHIEQTGVPMVFIDREVRKGKDFNAVMIDNFEGARVAAQHLVSLGHTTIAVIHGPLSSTPGRQRLEGFLEALSDASIASLPSLQVDGGFTEVGGREAMRKLLENDALPTAVLSCNNLMTIGALLELKAQKIQVPQDMSIIGFDDLELAPLLDPPLTVISRPTEEQGASAAELLIHQLRKNAQVAPKRIIMDVQLIQRSSCAPPSPRTEGGSRPPGSTFTSMKGLPS